MRKGREHDENMRRTGGEKEEERRRHDDNMTRKGVEHDGE